MPHRTGAHSSDEEYRLPGGEPEPDVSLSRLKKRSRRRSSTSSARNDNYTSDIINNTRPSNNARNKNTDDDVVCVTINDDADDDNEALVPDSTENTLDETPPTDTKATASSPTGYDNGFDNDDDDDDDDDDLDNIEPLPDFHRKRSVDDHHSRSSAGADGDDENSRLAESVAASDATERQAGDPLDDECSRSRSDSRSLGGVGHQDQEEDDDELVSSSVEKAASKAKAARQASSKKSRDNDTGKPLRTTSRRRQLTSTDEDDDDGGADEDDDLYDLSKDPNAVAGDDDDDFNDDGSSESDFEAAPKAKSKAKAKTSSSAKEKRKKPSAAASASAPATKKARLGPAVRKAIAMSKPTATTTAKNPVGSSTLLNRGTTVGGSGGIRKQLGARLPIRSGLGRPSTTTSKSPGASTGSTAGRASSSGTPATPRMRSGLSKKAVVPRLHAYLPRK